MKFEFFVKFFGHSQKTIIIITYKHISCEMIVKAPNCIEMMLQSWS